MLVVTAASNPLSTPISPLQPHGEMLHDVAFLLHSFRACSATPAAQTRALVKAYLFNGFNMPSFLLTSALWFVAFLVTCHFAQTGLVLILSLKLLLKSFDALSCHMGLLAI